MPWLPRLFGSVSHRVRHRYHHTGFHDSNQPVVLYYRKANRSGCAAAETEYPTPSGNYVAGWSGAAWRGLEIVRPPAAGACTGQATSSRF